MSIITTTTVDVAREDSPTGSSGDPLEASGLQALLDQCTDFSSGAGAALDRYAALLRGGELATPFAALCCAPPTTMESVSDEKEEVLSSSQLVTDLVKLPDRTFGLRGPAQLADYPAELLPAAYCSHLLRNLALGLLRVHQNHQAAGWTAFRADFPRRLLESLLLNYREPLLAAMPAWWRFIAALTAASAKAAAALADGLFAPMGLGATEKCFLSFLATLPGPSDLGRLFGPTFRQPSRRPIIENNLFIRGLRGVDDKSVLQQLRQLMSFLQLLNPVWLRHLLEAGLRMFAEGTVVEAASPEELLQLCRSLAACLAALDEASRVEMRRTALPLIMRGSLVWLDSGPLRRNLGMSMVLVLLKGLGEERLPEWEVADPALHAELTQLAAPTAPDQNKLESEDSLDSLLAAWESINQPVKAAAILPKRTEMVVPVINTPSSQPVTKPPLDSDDDDDDDDLPTYDMSRDVKVGAKDAPPLRFLRDIMDHLGEAGDAADPEACFRALPALCARQLAHEDPSVVSDLLRVMLYAENRCDTAQWFSLREAAMLAVIRTRPVEAARRLVPAVFDREQPLATRLAVLDWLAAAGPQVQEQHSGPGGAFPEYIRIAVLGLCCMTGWGQLEISGFDSQLAAHLLLSTGALLRLGSQLPGWEGLVTAYLELALVTASSSRAVLQSAVLHSISLVTVLMKPYQLRGRLRESLGRAVQWAAQLEGQPQETAQQVVMMAACLEQEARKEELAHQLQATSISVKGTSLTTLSI